MSYITTNIRIPKEDYLRLKAQAAKQRKSLSAVVREKISQKSQKSSREVMDNIQRLANHNAKILKGWDSLKALREIRST